MKLSIFFFCYDNHYHQTLKTKMETPIPIIINTDPGIDDVLAIILALSHPEKVQIRAICLTFGNTSVNNGYKNILRLFSIVQKYVEKNPDTQQSQNFKKSLNSEHQILLARGAFHPLQGLSYDASDYHGKDGLGNIADLPNNPFPVPIEIPKPLLKTDKEADEVILEILRNSESGTVQIVSLGPLTNLALAWKKDPETFVRVSRISAMAGNLDVPGNDTPCAEFNAFADPFAFRSLLQDAPQHSILKDMGKHLPFHLVPLDIAKHYKVPFSRLCSDGDSEKNILQEFIAAILARVRQRAHDRSPNPSSSIDRQKYDNFSAYDPFAMAHAIFCPTAFSQDHLDEVSCKWQSKTRIFGIETDGYLTRGECVSDRRQDHVNKPFTIPTGTPFNATFQKQIDPLQSDQETKSDLGTDTFAKSRKRMSQLAVSLIKPNKSDGAANDAKEKGHNPVTDSMPTFENQRPFTGEWDIVTSSPGIEWFKEMFLNSLTL